MTPELYWHIFPCRVLTRRGDKDRVLIEVTSGAIKGTRVKVLRRALRKRGDRPCLGAGE